MLFILRINQRLYFLPHDILSCMCLFHTKWHRTERNVPGLSRLQRGLGDESQDATSTRINCGLESSGEASNMKGLVECGSQAFGLTPAAAVSSL